jgi:HD-GYP domain-containing protein (c-di-GMP phosphodiesterase class II)
MADNNIPLWAPEVAASLLQGVLKKDPFTFFHCCRVGRAARKMGELLHLPPYDLAVLEFSGLFHDIGKVGVPESILLKPDRLTKDEFNIMKNHAEMSVQMLRPLTKFEFFRHMVPGVRYHHERFDGVGYPIGMKGEQIPLFARVVMVVDAVDAMLNTRPYRQALSWDYVKKELVEHQGSQFDPNLAKLYLQHTGLMEDQDQAAREEIVIASVLKAA